MKLLTILAFCFCLFQIIITKPSNPVVKKWVKSTGLGYSNALTNVFKIQYSSSYAWVSTNSIPSYTIGPWAENPNDAAGKNYIFKFPLVPTYNTGTKIATPLGQIGLWINGVTIFNADDGMSYNNQNVWDRNAYFWEGVSFDSCNGHPDQNSQYHSHISSSCLFKTNKKKHSPLIGFAFDGFPIYGPYGYSKSKNSKSSIKRIKTSYRLRSISDRTTLPDGTTLSPDKYGPAIDSTYPLGAFIQDYEYVKGLGDLDEYNGRFCKTPEYPNGVYAYFVATDSSLNPVYPFSVGPYYRGVVASGNTGPNSGTTNPTETTKVYYEYK